MFLDKSEKFIHDVVREWLRWSWCKIDASKAYEGEDWFPKPVAN